MINPINGVSFGQERTAAQCLERAAREYDQASRMLAARHPVGYTALAEGHERAAKDYEKRARELEAAQPTPPTATAATSKRSGKPKVVAKDIEAAVRAARLYIGKGLTMRFADEKKLYRSMNAKIAAVAKRRGMDDAAAYQQIMTEAKRRGGILAMPGMDI